MSSSDTTLATETANPSIEYTLPHRPWRRYTTPFPKLVNHNYSGQGTESSPFIVDWLPDDPEDPLRWPGVYRWTCIAMASLATFAVALSSSCYSGGIDSLVNEFGASLELLTAGTSFPKEINPVELD